MRRTFFGMIGRVVGVLVIGMVLSPAQAGSLRVAAWNVEWFPGRSPEPTPEAVAAHIPLVQEGMARLNPDILLVSEVQSWQAMELALAKSKGLRIHVVSAYASQDTGELWRQQLAIASKLPCVAAWAESFRPTIPGLSRGFAFAALEEPGTGKLILVYAVHLKSNRSRNDREAEINFIQRDESAELILEHVAAMRRTMFRGREMAGVIVGGDINTDHDGKFGDRVVEILTGGGFQNTWDRTPREKRLTWLGSPQFEPTPFDYIFLQGFPHVQATLVSMPEGSSDHAAVLVEIPLR